MRVGGGKQEECRKRAGEKEGREREFGRGRRVCKGENGKGKEKRRIESKREQWEKKRGGKGMVEGERGKVCMYTTGQPRVSVI